DMLAYHRPILAFHQGVIRGLIRSRFGEFCQQLVQQFRHSMIDELRAVVAMKTADTERKLVQHRLQYRHQVALTNRLGGTHNFPLRDRVHSVDVVQPGLSLAIALMHRIDSDPARLAARVRFAPLPSLAGYRQPLLSASEKLLRAKWR